MQPTPLAAILAAEADHLTGLADSCGSFASRLRSAHLEFDTHDYSPPGFVPEFDYDELTPATIPASFAASPVRSTPGPRDQSAEPGWYPNEQRWPY